MTRNHWPFLPLGRIYSSLLAMLRAFWSLEPQAYLVKTNIQQKHAATPQLMTHKQTIRPHFAVSTCCTVLSSHGDDPSWTQYESLFLLSMKSQEQTFYYSYLLQMHHISSRTCSSDRSLLVWREFLESNRQDTDKERSCKVYVGKTVWKTSWKLQPCKGEVGSIEAPWQITPPVSCLKGHSCEKCLSNYVPGLDLKMQKHVSSISSYFFSNEIQGHQLEWILELSFGNAGPSSQAHLYKSMPRSAFKSMSLWINHGVQKVEPPESHWLLADRV